MGNGKHTESQGACVRRIRAGVSLALVALVLVMVSGCATIKKLDGLIDVKTFGADFDDLCIVGKIRADAATWLNSSQEAWKQHRDYTEPRQPDPVKADDRLFNGDCSVVAKCLGKGDFDCAMHALEAVADQGE